MAQQAGALTVCLSSGEEWAATNCRSAFTDIELAKAACLDLDYIECQGVWEVAGLRRKGELLFIPQYACCLHARI